MGILENVNTEQTDYAALVPAAVKTYKTYLIEQYANAPKAVGTVELMAQTALIDFIELTVQDSFNIDTAVGVQLDVLGKYIGFSRQVNFPVQRNFFKFYNPLFPDRPQVGFTNYTDPTVNANSSFYLYQYANGQIYFVPDDQYRILLKLKIILNHSNNSLASIANSLYATFGTNILCIDSQNMILTYFVYAAADPVIKIALQAKLLPKPMGVSIGGAYVVPNPTKVFGFSLYNRSSTNKNGFCTYQTGFNGAHWLNYKDKV